MYIRVRKGFKKRQMIVVIERLYQKEVQENEKNNISRDNCGDFIGNMAFDWGIKFACNQCLAQLNACEICGRT